MATFITKTWFYKPQHRRTNRCNRRLETNPSKSWSLQSRCPKSSPKQSPRTGRKPMNIWFRTPRVLPASPMVLQGSHEAPKKFPKVFKGGAKTPERHHRKSKVLVLNCRNEGSGGDDRGPSSRVNWGQGCTFIRQTPLGGTKAADVEPKNQQQHYAMFIFLVFYIL